MQELLFLLTIFSMTVSAQIKECSRTKACSAPLVCFLETKSGKGECRNPLQEGEICKKIGFDPLSCPQGTECLPDTADFPGVSRCFRKCDADTKCPATSQASYCWFSDVQSLNQGGFCYTPFALQGEPCKQPKRLTRPCAAGLKCGADGKCAPGATLPSGLATPCVDKCEPPYVCWPNNEANPSEGGTCNTIPVLTNVRDREACWDKRRKELPCEPGYTCANKEGKNYKKFCRDRNKVTDAPCKIDTDCDERFLCWKRSGDDNGTCQARDNSVSEVCGKAGYPDRACFSGNVCKDDGTGVKRCLPSNASVSSGCKTTADCAGELICVRGACLKQPGLKCTNGSECATGKCVKSKCTSQ